MKRNNIIQSLFIGLVALIIVSCDAIVDEQYLENTATLEGVELTATQSTTGGNEIEFYMQTPGVSGYWDYMIGKGLTDRTTVTFPVTGTFDFKYVGTLGAEFFEKSTSVTIDTLDHEVPPEWAALLGDDAVAGKTWVFDGGPAPDGRQWWFMSDPGNPWGIWWNAAGDCCPPADAAGRMIFDLDGAANYTYYSGPDAEAETGIFVLNTDNKTLKINDSQLLGSMDGGGNDGVFNIVELTKNKMVLHVPNAAWATGWTWVFVPAE